MAFTFNSTAGSSTANSYVSVSDADDYFSGHFIGNEKWTNLDVTQKQQILVQSTNRIDLEKFGGQKNSIGQSLQWPRAFIFQRDAQVNQEQVFEGVGGRYYRDNLTIPTELKQATCEQCLNYIALANGDSTYDESDLEVLEQIEIGPIKYSIRPNMKSDRLPTSVKRLLKAIGPNGWMGEGSIKLER